MRKILLILLALFCAERVLARESFEGPSNLNDPIVKLVRNMPQDVANYIYRKVHCNHWSGEEPYDQERGEEITRNMDRLECRFLDNHKKTLKRRYAKKSAVIKAIDGANKLYY